MDSATITGILVATGGFLAVVATIVIFRITHHEAEIEKIKKEAVDSSSLTLESWTRLNKALQTEVDRLQNRVSRLEAEMEEDRKNHEAEMAALRKRLAAYESHA
jgi:molecular chaperone GrpE (heat shock protein)